MEPAGTPSADDANGEIVIRVDPGRSAARPRKDLSAARSTPGAPPDIQVEHLPTRPLPPFDIDQWPTTVLTPFEQLPTGRLADISFDQWPAPWPINIPIDQLPTGPLPAVRIDHLPTGPLAADTQWPSAPQRAGRTAGLGYVAVARTLIKSSAVYALAALGAPLISLVLAPFLTHHLTLTDYGILTVLNTAIGLAAGITQLGLGSAFFRTYSYEYTSRADRKRVLATIVLLLIATSLPLAAGVVVAAPSVAALLFGRPALSGDVTAAMGVVLVQNLTVPAFAWLRAEGRPLFFSVLALGNLLVSLAANIVFVGLLQMGVRGALYATGSGYACVAMCMLPLILWHAGVRGRADVAWSLLSFGVPQVFSFVAYWALQLLDRYLLSIMGSLAQTATYGVAYSLGSVLSTAVIVPFNLAWPTAMYAIARRNDAPEVYRLVFRWFSLLLLFGAFALSLAGRILLRWLFPAGYHAAEPVIPVVAVSIVLYGVYILFTTGISIRRKTWLAAAFMSAAAAANLALNLMLIPLYGSMGAAVATFVGYVVLALFAYVVNQRIYPIPFEVGRFVLALCVGVGVYWELYLLPALWGARWVWPLAALGLAAYGGWLLLLGRLGGQRKIGDTGQSLSLGQRQDGIL
jgi:O-antigen/teichoic acid export membrane protein